jgi:hypothetical protein
LLNTSKIKNFSPFLKKEDAVVRGHLAGRTRFHARGGDSVWRHKHSLTVALPAYHTAPSHNKASFRERAKVNW